MFCNHCGHKNADEAQFCNKCGGKVVATTSSTESGAGSAGTAGTAATETPAANAASGGTAAAAGSGAPPQTAHLPTHTAASHLPAEQEVWEGAMDWKAALNAWWLLSFLLVVPILVYACLVWYRRRSIHYRITTERITLLKGILSRESEDIQLIRIEDVQFSQGVLHRMLGVGNVRVISSDKSYPDMVIEGVPDPASFKEMLWKLVRERRRSMVAIEQLNY